MLNRLRTRGRPAPAPRDETPTEPTPVFTALRLFSAELVLSSGINATLQYLRSRSPRPARPGALDPAARRVGRTGAWAPLVLGGLGCAAQATFAFRPSQRALLATRVLNGLILGVGAAGAAEEIRAAVRSQSSPTVAPFLFGYTGLLGFLLDRQESVVAEEEAALTRRTRLLDRLIPERRTRIERIVVHV
jgi:hypothetical protein